MRSIQIGNITLEVAEGLEDILYSRATMFKQYISQLIYDVDIALFKQTKQKYLEAINKGQHSTGVILWENFDRAISAKQTPGVDALGICFALITKEPNESETRFDEHFLFEKLNRLNKEGLTRAIVEKEVENFMPAFPSIYPWYKQSKERLQVMTDILL